MKTLSPIKNRGFRFFAGLVDRIADIAGYTSIAAVSIAMLVIVYEVIGRYFFSLPTVWEVELSVMLSVYITFIGSAFTLKNNAHIRMDDIVLPYMNEKIKKCLAIITSVLAFCFCMILSFKSWEMFRQAISSGWKSETVWAPPLAIPYSFLAVGISIICLQYVVIIAESINSLYQEVTNG